MLTVHTVDDIRNQVGQWKKQGLTVGLVPTMGYLHEGHESLMQAARKQTDKLVVSIFVNPTQFGPNEDLEAYPRDPEHDRAICARNETDLIFMPDARIMYPEGFQTTVSVSGLTEGLCGRSRPVHFAGVCTVVCKLFNIVNPDFAYFGQKDAQQLAVVTRMAKDLNLPVTVVGCPIIREADGLAKSSRNAYLNGEERRAALSLSRSLQMAQTRFNQGERDSATLRALIMEELGKEPMLRPDYVEVVDSLTLVPVERLSAPALVAVAAFVGKTRLIDNVTLS